MGLLRLATRLLPTFLSEAERSFTMDLTAQQHNLLLSTQSFDPFTEVKSVHHGSFGSMLMISRLLNYPNWLSGCITRMAENAFLALKLVFFSVIPIKISHKFW